MSKDLEPNYISASDLSINTAEGVKVSTVIPELGGTYKLNSEAGASILVEHQVRFLDQGNFIGANYLFERLGIAQPAKLYAGPFLETTLIRDAIFRTIGQRFIDDSLTSDAEQMAALYNGAVIEKENLGLVIGEELTTEQVANLKYNIIWLIKENIEGHEVLVPRLYYNTTKIITKGAIIRAGELDIEASGDIYNEGEISSTKGDSTIKVNNLDNHGGTISSADDLILEVDGNLYTGNSHNELSDPKNGNNFLTERSRAMIEASDRAIANIKKNLKTSGGDINIGGDTQINVGGTATLGVSTTEHHSRVNTGDEHHHADIVEHSPTTINSGGDFRLSAEYAEYQRIMMYTDMSAFFEADEDIGYPGIENIYKVDSGSKESGFLSNKEVRDIKEERLTLPSEIEAGGDITIIAGGNLTTEGLQLNAGGDINIEAENMDADSALVSSHHEHHEKESGFLGFASKGSIGIGIGSRKSDLETNNEANIVNDFNAGGDVNINLEENLDAKGLVINAGGSASIKSENVNIESVENSASYKKEESSTMLGLKISAQESISGTVEKISNYGEGNKGDGAAQNAANVVNAIDTALSTVQTVLVPASASATYGLSHEQSSVESFSITNVNSEVKAKEDVNMDVEKDLTLSGANVHAGGILNVNAENATIESKQNHSGSSSESFSAGIGIGVNVSASPVSGVGASVGVSAHLSYANSQADRSWTDTPTTLTGEMGVNVNIDDTLTLTGAKIANEKDGEDLGNLTVKADNIIANDIEDFDNSESFGMNISTSITKGAESEDYAGSGVLGVNYSNENKEGVTRATVGQGDIITNSDISDLNRDIDKFQEITKDEAVAVGLAVSSELIEDPEGYAEKVSNAAETLTDPDALEQNMQDIINPQSYVDATSEAINNSDLFNIEEDVIDAAPTAGSGLDLDAENYDGNNAYSYDNSADGNDVYPVEVENDDDINIGNIMTFTEIEESVVNAAPTAENGLDLDTENYDGDNNFDNNNIYKDFNIDEAIPADLDISHLSQDQQNFIRENAAVLGTVIIEEVLLMAEELGVLDFPGSKEFVITAKFNGISTAVSIGMEIQKLPDDATKGDYAIKIGNAVLETSISSGLTAVGVAALTSLFALTPVGVITTAAVIGISSAVGTSYFINSDGKGALEDLIEFLEEPYEFHQRDSNTLTQDIYLDFLNREEFHALKYADKNGHSNIDEFRLFIKDMMEHNNLSFDESVELYMSGYFDQNIFIKNNSRSSDSEYYLKAYSDPIKGYTITIIENPAYQIYNPVLEEYNIKSFHSYDSSNGTSTKQLTEEVYNKLLDFNLLSAELQNISKDEFVDTVINNSTLLNSYEKGLEVTVSSIINTNYLDQSPNMEYNLKVKLEKSNNIYKSEISIRLVEANYNEEEFLIKNDIYSKRNVLNPRVEGDDSYETIYKFDTKGTLHKFDLKIDNKIQQIAKDNGITVDKLLSLAGNEHLADIYIHDFKGTGLDYLLTRNNQEVFLITADIDGDIVYEVKDNGYAIYNPEADNSSIYIETDTNYNDLELLSNNIEDTPDYISAGDTVVEPIGQFEFNEDFGG